MAYAKSTHTFRVVDKQGQVSAQTFTFDRAITRVAAAKRVKAEGYKLVRGKPGRGSTSPSAEAVDRLLKTAIEAPNSFLHRFFCSRKPHAENEFPEQKAIREFRFGDYCTRESARTALEVEGWKVFPDGKDGVRKLAALENVPVLNFPGILRTTEDGRYVQRDSAEGRGFRIWEDQPIPFVDQPPGRMPEKIIQIQIDGGSESYQGDIYALTSRGRVLTYVKSYGDKPAYWSELPGELPK